MGPITVEDNEILKKVHCKNVDTLNGKSFSIQVIPEQSVPVVRILNVASKLKVNRGETKKIECTVTGEKFGDVKDFGAKWFIDDLRTSKLPSNAKTENKPEATDKNTTTIKSTLTIENVNIESFSTWFCVSQVQFAKGALEVVRKYYATIEVVNDEALSEEIKKKKGEDVIF